MLHTFYNENVTTVAPFGRTLIELSAGVGISDAGLATATNLVTLLAYHTLHKLGVWPRLPRHFLSLVSQGIVALETRR